MKFTKFAALATVSFAAFVFFGAPVMAAAPNLKGDSALATKTAAPDMQGVLDTLAGMGGKPIETLSAAEARKQPTPADAVKKLLKGRGQDPQKLQAALNVETSDIFYKAAADDQKARIYRPKEAGDQPLPVVLYIHGGGWVIADIDVYDEAPRALARKANAMVVSIEYRHAPENKFPAAHEDAFAAYKWLLDNAQKYHGDPSRIAVVGESAGGNMAVNVAITARDAAIETPVFVGAIYPVAGSDMNTPSYMENASAKPLNKPMMEWFVKNTFDDPSQAKDKRIDLIHADLKGLPQTTIITAEIDPLRSDGEMLAKAMKDAGGNVTIENFTGVTHEFFGMDAIVAKAGKAQARIADDLKKAFEMDPGAPQ